MAYVYTGGVGATTPESAAVNAAAIQQSMRSGNGYSPLDGVNADFLRSAQSAVDATNSAYAASADRANAFSAEQAALVRDFNAREAQKTREWQEYMSNTAHQREVSDLLAAGLNPVLSANSGAQAYSGASASASSAPSGQRAEVADYTQALVSLLGTMLTSQTSLLNGMVSAEASKAVADKYNAVNEMLGLLNAEVTRYGIEQGVANTHYSADSSRAAAAMSAGAVLGAAATSAGAAKYSADLSLQNAREQRDWNAKHPGNVWEATGSALNEYGGESALGQLLGSAAKIVKGAWNLYDPTHGVQGSGRR